MGKRGTVLVVEDDDDVREALLPVLEYEGYAVMAAANGREALERLRSEGDPPGVILLDLMMPVMDGWQFRAEQLRDGELASIPVVVLSALGPAGPNVQTLRADAYLQKPIDVDGLLDVIRRFC